MLVPNWLKVLMKSRKFFVFIFGLFVALRLPALFISVAPWSDGAWYVNRAIEMTAGKGYAENGIPTAFWPVGYPGFLAGLFSVFGPDIFVVKLANLLLGSASLLLLYMLSRDIFDNEWGGRLAMLLYAIYPNQIAYTALALTEVLFSFLLLLAVWVFVRSENVWAAILCGVLMGAATLVKAQTIVFPALLLVGYGWAQRRRISAWRFIVMAAAVYGACILVIVPWMWRNYQVFGTLVYVATSGGIALYAGNNPGANGDYFPAELLPPELRPNAARQVEIDRQAAAAAIAWIAAHPGQAIALLPLKFWRLWAPDGEGEWGFQAGYSGYNDHVLLFRILRVMNQAYYVVLMMLFGGSLLRLLKRKSEWHDWTYLGLIVFLYTTLISTVFSGQSRYHFPAMPWLTIYAAWFIIIWFTERIRSETNVSPRSVR